MANDTTAQPYAGLSNDELAQRVCLLDMLDQIVEISAYVYGLSDEQLKEHVDEELRGRAAYLKARIAECLHEERNDELAKRDLMLEMIEELAAEDREKREHGEDPTIRELLHGVTNVQVRETLDDGLRQRVRRLRERPRA
jgi:hypothetical protein